jgi:hypothetical protein
VRPWIDPFKFWIVKAVGSEKPTAFLFFEKESSNVFNTSYIKYPRCLHACQNMPMDNVPAPWGAGSLKLILLSLI